MKNKFKIKLELARLLHSCVQVSRISARGRTSQRAGKIRNSQQRGFGLVEVILASAIFALLLTALVGAFLYGEESTMLAGNRAHAIFLAEEGLEASHNLRDESFSNLADGLHGLVVTGSVWAFSGTSDTVGIFTRQVNIESLDVSRKTVTSTVTWQQNEQRQGTVALVTYFHDWSAAKASGADNLVVDISNAEVDPGDNTRAIGITLENIGTTAINIDQMTVSWTGALGGTRLNEISIDGGSVWSGIANSGDTSDITNYVLTTGAGVVPLDFLDFNKDITNISLTITFIMTDASSKTVYVNFADTTAPAAITDLALSGATTSSIDLDWTAPGDDGSTGIATSYDVRYSTATITGVNWSSATSATGEPTPSVAGSSESMTVSGLSEGMTYYFAIKTSDEVPNASAISNVPNLATLFSQASYLSVETVGAVVNPGDNTQVTGITVENTGPLSITIDQVIISWTGALPGTRWDEISIDSVSVWSGSAASGGTADITDVVLTSGSGAKPIDFINWSKNVTGITFSVTFVMGDASTKVISNITP